MQERESFRAAVRRVFRDYVLGMGRTGAFGKVLEKAGTDPDFKNRLVESPRQVLEENGVKLPEGIKVEVLVNTDKIINVVLPPYVGKAHDKAES